MKCLICSVYLLMIFNLMSYCQVSVLSSRNFERVIFPNSEDSIERKYFQNIAFITNDYVKKFHKNVKLDIIIKIYNTPYEVRIDDQARGLIAQLINKQKSLNYGLVISLPDSGICISRVFNLIDLGLATKDSSFSCLQKYVSTTNWFSKDECYPSREVIDQSLDMKLADKKIRFLKRMMRKYSLEDTDCINKHSFDITSND